MRRFHDVGFASTLGRTAGQGRAGVLACGLVLTAGCGGEVVETGDESGDAGACVATAPPSCEPLYEPTFDALYTRRLATGCATSSVCHAADGRLAFAFGDADEAWAALLSEERVVPGRPACGLLIDRLTASDPARRMPPGVALSPAELCVVETWIAGGAKR